MGKFLVDMFKWLLGGYLLLAMFATISIMYFTNGSVRDMLWALTIMIINLWSLTVLVKSGFFDDI